jgi:hypothetical protein
VILRASGLPEIAECRGRLLGVEPEARTLDCPLDLAPGDAVVLYTDGISEGRIDRPLSAGTIRRRAPARPRQQGGGDRAPRGRARRGARRGGPLRDEVAVLALRETER